MKAEQVYGVGALLATHQKCFLSISGSSCLYRLISVLSQDVAILPPKIMKTLRILSAIIALFLLLVATPALADDSVDDSDGDGTVVEDSEDSEETEEQEDEDEANLSNCDNLRGLERASCRVEVQLKEKGEWEEGAPYCKPGARQTGLQRAYCMITRNQQKKVAKGEKSKLTRAHQKARRYEYRSTIKLRRQEFKTEVKETRQQFRINVRNARKGVSRTIDNRVDVLKEKRKKLRERMSDRTKELEAKRSRKEAAKQVNTREGRRARLKRESRMHQSSDDGTTEVRTRTERRSRRSGDTEERRVRVREIDSPRVSE